MRPAVCYDRTPVNGFTSSRASGPARWAAALLCLAVAGPALAGKVVLRIRAGNPIDQPQRVQVKSNLPARVGTNDIVNLGGLDLGYDVKNDLYYVYKDVDLGARQIVEFSVEIRDIWVVPEADLDRLVQRAESLTALLEGKEYHDSAAALLADVRRNADFVRENQAVNAIKPGVTPIQHIRAYETGIKVLSGVKKDVGRIENLVMAAGINPGELIGEARDSPPPAEPRIDPADYRPAVVRITARNTSPSEKRTVDINHDLPPEVKPADVLDAGGLEVGTDARRGTVYVFRKGVELDPGQALTFDVRIRDKWNLVKPRAAALRERIDTTRAQVANKDQFQAMAALLDGAERRLAEIEAGKGPDALSEAYVAFHREQGARLDAVEKQIHRVESALRPVDRRQRVAISNVKPPTMKTTWLIIYIILGFLAAISIVFFLRWIGRTKGENLSA